MVKKKRQKTARLAIGIGVVAIVLILAVLLFQMYSGSIFSFSLTGSSLKNFTIDSVSVKSPANKTDTETTVAFLKEALPESSWPKTLTFAFHQKGNDVKGDAYIANWSRDGVFWSILFGFDKKNKTLAYLRLWTMPQKVMGNDKEAASIAETMFTKEYLGAVGSLTCAKRAESEGVKETTVCAKLTPSADSGLRGVTVRSPVVLSPPPGTAPPPGSAPPPTVTVVSACLIAPSVSAIYPDSTCI